MGPDAGARVEAGVEESHDQGSAGSSNKGFEHDVHLSQRETVICISSFRILRSGRGLSQP